MGEQPHRRSTKKAARGRSMRVSPTQSRKRVKGQCPLQGAGTASLLGFGATPQLFLVKSIQKEKSTKCRQRSVPASNFARPQPRPQVTKKTSTERKRLLPMLVSRAHLARQCASCGESSLGARLRTRKITGRDAALPATKAAGLSAFSIIGLTVERLGRCPKPHQRRRLWTPQGAIAP